MRVEILRPVMISGEPASAGSFVEVSLADAQMLIGLGKARKSEEPKAVAKAEPEPEPKAEPKAKEEVKPKRTRSTAPKE